MARHLFDRSILLHRIRLRCRDTCNRHPIGFGARALFESQRKVDGERFGSDPLSQQQFGLEFVRKNHIDSDRGFLLMRVPVRSALGVQQAPPNQIINGVAFMLSLFVMYPTATKMYDAANQVIAETRAPDSLVSTESSTYILNIAAAAKEPLKDFLKRNSSIKHQALFYRIAYRVLPEDHRKSLQPDDIIILVPAFITSQLKEAFEIGVLIYIPFFVIDLVTSNCCP